MDRQTIINIIELVAIIVAASFGILGSVTKTKDSNGKLTRWGIVAVVGIILTNSFSFVNNYLKQQNAAEARVADAKKNAKADSTKIAELKIQQQFQDSLIRKTDRSLDEQLEIQGTIGGLLESFRQSLGTQDRILSSNRDIAGNVNRNLKTQGALLEKQSAFSKNQDSLLKDFNREMYKLNNASLSFKVSYDCYQDEFKFFTRQVMDSAQACILRNPKYKEEKRFFHNKMAMNGDYMVENGTIKILAIYLEQNSPLIPASVFDGSLNEFMVDICFAQKDIRNSIYLHQESDLVYSARAWNEKNGFVSSNQDDYFTYAGNTQVNYEIHPQQQRLSLFVQTTRVKKSEEKMNKLRSLIDLPGNNVKICFFGDADLGKSMKLEWFTMGFGEGFTRKLRFRSDELEKIQPEGTFFYYKVKKEDIF